jgi:hypothetical protein
VVLVMTVDVKPGRSEVLRMRHLDDPAEVAANFVSRHGLPDAVQQPLADHLQQHLMQTFRQVCSVLLATLRPCARQPTATWPSGIALRVLCWGVHENVTIQLA